MTLAAGPADSLHRFGRFIADPAVGRLYDGADHVPLTPKSFRVLMVLVELQGQLVDKDELFRRVWPGTFVEQNNLARNISMIRKALHERDPNQEYIVTVTGRGYRFVAPVSRIPRAAFEGPDPAVTADVAGPGLDDSNPDLVSVQGAAASAPEPLPGAVLAQQGAVGADLNYPARSARSLIILLAALVAGVLATAFVPGVDDEAPDRPLWQLTTAGRLDGDPAWSPDGRLVAYSSDRSGHFDIWVQPVSGGIPLRITSGGARDSQPAWSPDGQFLAFRSEREGGGIFVIPALGGTERRISAFGHRPRWSPDGSKILFTDAQEVYVAALDGTSPSRLAAEPLARLTGRVQAAWHPDGRRVSVYGNHLEQGWTFWTIPLEGGPAIRSRLSPAVAEHLRDIGLRLGTFAWGPAGDRLFFEGRTEQAANLWRVPVNPETLEWIERPERLTTSSSLESDVILSPDGRRLAFSSRVERTVALSLPFDPVAGRILGDGKAVTPEGANAEILDISPDGTQLVYRVAGHNRHELWIRSLGEGADRLRTVESGAAIIQPRWSRDGTQLAYLRRPLDPMQGASVVLLAAERDGEETELPSPVSPEMVYDWSVDGRSLLVRCRSKSAYSAICRLASSAGGGPPADMRVIASEAGSHLYAAKHSPDGRWVSFIAAPDLTRSTVFVSPATGGPWIPLTAPEDRYFEDKPRWSPDGRTVYFLSNRTGFWNVWGQRFDADAGKAVGEPFQVSHFDSSERMVRRDISNVQIAITRDRLILPVTQTSGAVWVLENVDQ
jgi:Tol biopolymer transport system component/DNA-binding winged helix-turn-helix (wHTH) protein